MRYVLYVAGDIEQAVLAMQERDIEAAITQASYLEEDHKAVLVVNADNGTALEGQLDQWQAEHSYQSGQLDHYERTVGGG